jgi:ATP-dependent Lon protease
VRSPGPVRVGLEREAPECAHDVVRAARELDAELFERRQQRGSDLDPPDVEVRQRALERSENWIERGGLGAARVAILVEGLIQQSSEVAHGYARGNGSARKTLRDLAVAARWSDFPAGDGGPTSSARVGRAYRVKTMPTDKSATPPTPSELAQELPLIALPDVVMFPGTGVQLELAGTAIAERLGSRPDALVAVFTPKGPLAEELAAADLYPIGTVARVVKVAKQPGGLVVVLQGAARVVLESLPTTRPFPLVTVRPAQESDVMDDELGALFLALRQSVQAVMSLLRVPPQFAEYAASIETPGALSDLVASRMEVTTAERAELLATLDVKARVRAVLARLAHRIEVLKMRNDINAQVQSDIGQAQREHMLREQMKAIEKELGEGEGDNDSENDLDTLDKRIAEADLPPEASEVAQKQMKRLRSMQTGSPESAAVRTYLEWIADLPWKTATADAVDIASVRAALDADHYGLEKVKKRIVEYLAVRKVKSNKKGPILCLIGPPGVGKTSLGKSIAHALGRKFHRISLGGVHDEAAIRGHRRTYVGALPGNIIQGMKKAGVTNPVFMLDEVDKLGQDALHGDPSSALLEVLDPEQNATFTDHYLEIPYDLSNVLFVATANIGDTIPAPLRDRMETIEIPSYTRREKLAIARRHLVPKQLSEHGVSPEKLDITDDALSLIIERYAREAGVRSLEKNIAAIVRGVAVRFAEGHEEPTTIRSEQDVRAFLGPARHEDQVAERTEDAGVATGLAWTPVGGQILFVEATRMPGSGKLTLTGQLGDVMKESATAALSYVRANTQRWGIARDFLDKSDVHIHVPSGGLPKDGPSAGVTMLTALVSLLTGIRVRHDVAMTGEITLRGRVLPIGGLKEKVLAAHRAGIRRVIVPERNRADLDEVPDEIKNEIEIVFVSQMGQVIDAALQEPPRGQPTPSLDGGAAPRASTLAPAGFAALAPSAPPAGTARFAGTDPGLP